MQLLMMNHISDVGGQGDRIKKEEKKRDPNDTFV